MSPSSPPVDRAKLSDYMAASRAVHDDFRKLEKLMEETAAVVAIREAFDEPKTNQSIQLSFALDQVEKQEPHFTPEQLRAFQISKRLYPMYQKKMEGKTTAQACRELGLYPQKGNVLIRRLKDIGLLPDKPLYFWQMTA